MKKVSHPAVRLPALPILTSANELRAMAIAMADDAARSLIESSCMMANHSPGSLADEFAHFSDPTDANSSGPSPAPDDFYRYDLSRVDSLALPDVRTAVLYLLGRQGNASSTPRPAFRLCGNGTWVWFVAP